MKLLFKQRFFSWFDSYDIFDENENVLFSVEGQLSWGHRLHILNAKGEHVGTVKQRVMTFLPRFELYFGEEYVGCITKEFSFFRPNFSVDHNGWSIDGDFLEWDYQILDSAGALVAEVSKELFRMTDTYVIDVVREEDALSALMVVLAIDAEKDSRN
ncbi:MAG: LURP-one-related family protein [Clostridia bacterium]|jgi:uncharacterized protein YxjI|nr:LURP-one-related family protein [Clostridia bacterium]